MQYSLDGGELDGVCGRFRSLISFRPTLHALRSMFVGFICGRFGTVLVRLIVRLL